MPWPGWAEVCLRDLGAGHSCTFFSFVCKMQRLPGTFQTSFRSNLYKNFACMQLYRLHGACKGSHITYKRKFCTESTPRQAISLLLRSESAPSAAITTKERLSSFLARTSGHHSHKKAWRALKYIENGSASIMESIVYMFLTLPHLLGGYGLGGAVFNYEIRLEDEAGKHLRQKRCFMDLYYKAAKLAIECESFAFHSRPSEQGKDAIRSAILDRHGIEVMHLNTIQLYDKTACKDFVLNLSSRLDKRIHIRTEKFDEMNDRLRSLLPSGNSLSN